LEAIGGLERALRLAAWLVVATVGVVMLTQAFGWSGTRLVAVLQTLTPYLIVIMAPIAIVAMRRGQPRLAFTAGLIGASGVLMAGPLVFGPSQPPARDAAIGVTVASVNLLYTNETIGDSADVLVSQDADVIVFSEYTAEFQAVLTAHRLSDEFPFRIERDGLQAGGIAIWSRFPLREQERLATTNYSIDAVVDGPDGSFSMVGIHPPAPVFDFDAWKHDLELLRARAADATSPTLLIGDVNASYWHPMFRDLLSEDFVDAHMAHGNGFSTSWPNGDWRPRFVRLDHALTGRGLVSTGVDDFDVPGSDHLGFIVTVAPAR
jgi:endonuclease/exonuclease/phosphatase (EEP) superfamily protein YafD